MKCEVVKDLLPSYIDGLTSSITNEEIEKHLEQCEECTQYYLSMNEQNFCVSNEIENRRDRIRKNKDSQIVKKFRRTKLKWIGISCAVVSAMIIMIFYVFTSYIQIPYSQVQVSAGIQEEKTNTLEFDDGTSQIVRIAGVKIMEKVGNLGFSRADFRNKKVMIDGEEKNVVFVNCQTTIKEYIFQEKVMPNTEATYVQGGYKGKDFENVDIIYYLDKNIKKIDNASEKEVLHIIQKYGTLLWEK